MNKTVTIGNLMVIFLITACLASAAAAAYLYQRLTVAQAYSKTLNDQLWKTNHDLHETSARLQETQRQLAATGSALGQTQSKLSAAQSESQRRLQTIFAQQDNVRTLKTCLLGVASDDVYFRDGVKYFFQWFDSRDDDDLNQAVINFREGRNVLESVSSDCDRAAALFQ
jgi:ABC-type phosphate transport system auxiliary subunit